MFRLVYRAAMEVSGDEEEQGFYAPVPQELSYADWHFKVLSAFQSEMGVSLSLNDATVWENVPPAIEQQIRQRLQVEAAPFAWAKAAPLSSAAELER
jgi:hypothetical protein